MRRLGEGRPIDPAGVGHAAVPRGLRVGFWTMSAILVGYGLYGAIRNDLVLPAGKSRFGEAFPATHLHGWAAFVALIALICFCVAIRAAIIDQYLRFSGPGQRRRASTFALLILSFGLFMGAMMLQVRAELAAM